MTLPLENKITDLNSLNLPVTNSTDAVHSLEYLYLFMLKAFLLKNSSNKNEDSITLERKFITTEDLLDVNSLNVKIFLDTIRAAQTEKTTKNFLEILLYPISKDAKVEKSLFGDLVDSSYSELDADKLLLNFKSSQKILLSFRKFVVAVEKEAFINNGISTELTYFEFKKQFLREPKEDVLNRYIVLAYFITNVLEHILIKKLNRQKRNKLKQLVNFINERKVMKEIM